MFNIELSTNLSVVDKQTNRTELFELSTDSGIVCRELMLMSLQRKLLNRIGRAGSLGRDENKKLLLTTSPVTISFSTGSWQQNRLQREETLGELIRLLVEPWNILASPFGEAVEAGTTKVRSAFHRHTYTYTGLDQTMLAHPALVSFYVGLLRNCLRLSRVGAKEILRLVPRATVTKALREKDKAACFRIIKKMAPVFLRRDSPVHGRDFEALLEFLKADRTFLDLFCTGLERDWSMGQLYGLPSHCGFRYSMRQKRVQGILYPHVEKLKAA